MINLTQKTYSEINGELAERLAKIRKKKKLSQTELAKRSGVSFGSLKRFEQKGEISLSSFTKLAIALEVDGELEDLFSNPPITSIQEIIDGQG